MTDLLRAMECLPHLLEIAKLPAKGWRAETLSRRQDQVMHRIVLGLKGESRDQLVLKVLFRPVDAANFEQVALRQSQVNDALPDSPRILAFDYSTQATLMTRLPGTTLLDRCTFVPATAVEQPLSAAGAWTDRFHTVFGAEERQFQPKHTVRYIETLVGKVRSRETPVARRGAFLKLADAVLQLVPAFDDCRTVAAANHQDLNCRNIIISGGQATGLDFGPGKVLPVGHDLARLFCHYGALCAPIGETADGPLPGVDLSAFFRGYKLVPQGDQTVRFLTFARLLSDWKRLPKERAQRSFSEQLRLEGLTRLAEISLKLL